MISIISFILKVVITVAFVNPETLLQHKNNGTVIFPQSLPYVFVGLRNALSHALVVTIVIEMTMPGNTGLGYSILDSYRSFRVPEMYLYILFTGILGWLLNKGFLILEKHQLHWVQ